MPGQIVHLEIPADDTAKGREFWGSLFRWHGNEFGLWQNDPSAPAPAG